MPARTRASSKRTGSTSSSIGGSASGSTAKPLCFGGENNASITSFLKPQAQTQRSLSVKSTVVEDEYVHPRPRRRHEESSSSISSTKGKHIDSDMWSELYAPASLDELAVHSRKVGDVRQWLSEAMSDTRVSKYRKVLVLTGTAGCGKSTTIKLLAQDMGLRVEEYLNDSTYRFNNDEYDGSGGPSKQFATYLGKAATYRRLSFNGERNTNQRQLILVEDLPNVLETQTREATHQALRAHCLSVQSQNTPLVIIVSDTGTRGTGGSADEASSFLNKQVIDARLVVPSDVLDEPYCQTLHFNPLAKTFLKKHLNALFDKHAQAVEGYRRPHDEALDLVIESSNGDIRSAVNTLQMLSQCALPGSVSVDVGSRRKRKTGSLSESTRAEIQTSLDSMARRETSLNLFHSLAKVLRNKRHGFDDEKVCDCEDQPQPLPLPQHMEWRSKTHSHINPTTLFQDIPVDTTTFFLYLAHNYPAYCSDSDEASVISDALSWSDCTPYGTSQHISSNMFEYVVRTALDTLPTPSLKRGQKMRKPAHFAAEHVRREREQSVREHARHTLTLTGQADVGAVSIDVLPMLTRIWHLGDIEPSLRRTLIFGDKRFDTLVSDILGENDNEGDLGSEVENEMNLRNTLNFTASSSQQHADKMHTLKEALGAVDIQECNDFNDIDEEIEEFSD